MDTSIEPLEGNKVKLHIAISEQEFEPAINAAFRKLAQEVRIPGFRPGKAPRRILEARFGADVAREQALKDGLPEFYADAVIAESIDVSIRVGHLTRALLQSLDGDAAVHHPRRPSAPPDPPVSCATPGIERDADQ